MFCKSCGTPLEEGQVYCPNCGAENIPEPQPQQPVQPQQPTQQTYQQPYQQPAQPQQAQPATANTMALLGLIFAFIFPIVGLICSILGLKRAKEMNGVGRGLALGGLIVSIVWFALVIIYAVIAGALIGAAAGGMY